MRWPFAILLASASCASSTELSPVAPIRPPPADLKHAAERTISGVRIVAQGMAWQGDPAIREHVHPLRVMIENFGESALEIRYDSFSLVSDRGDRCAARPPLQIDGTVDKPVRVALPEGVLRPGGRISGFLYFEPIDERARMVSFRADLVSAGSGEMIGTLSIPFEVEHDYVAAN